MVARTALGWTSSRRGSRLLIGDQQVTIGMPIWNPAIPRVFKCALQFAPDSRVRLLTEVRGPGVLVGRPGRLMVLQLLSGSHILQPWACLRPPNGTELLASLEALDWSVSASDSPVGLPGVFSVDPHLLDPTW